MADQGLSFEKRFSRREVLRTIGGGALALGAADLLAACGEIKGSNTTSSGTIVIGYVSPQTGALAGFASGDNFVLPQVRSTCTYKHGLEFFSAQAGYHNIDGGAYTDGTQDYSGMISNFKSKNAQLFTNAPIPPDFNQMWKQASQAGFKPKLATVAKVLLFPADTEAIGDLVNNVATDAWWTPYHPYSSTLTGQTCRQFADAFESSTGKQWVQSIGSVPSLFEIAHKAFTGVDDPHNHTAVATQLKTMNYTGISGPLDFTKGPMPGIAIQKPVGVQWKKGTKFPYSMVVVDNSANKNVPVNGDLAPTNP